MSTIQTVEYSLEVIFFFRFSVSKRFVFFLKTAYWSFENLLIVNKHGRHFVFISGSKRSFLGPTKTYRQWILIGQSLRKLTGQKELNPGLMKKLMSQFVTTMKAKKKKERCLISTLSGNTKKLFRQATKLAEEGWKCLPDPAGIVNKE